MKSIMHLVTLFTASALIAVPSLASAAFSINLNWSSGGGAGGCNSSNICGVAANILFIINSVLVPTIFALAFIVFLYGVAQKYIFSRGDVSKIEEGHKLILWGLIGFVVMVSLWGLVNVVANTFGLSGDYAPELPTSY